MKKTRVTHNKKKGVEAAHVPARRVRFTIRDEEDFLPNVALIPYGKLTDKQLDAWPKRKISCVIAKRALLAAYGGENDEETCIVDLLADLRHVCEHLKLDFDALDVQALGHYHSEARRKRLNTGIQ